jgi:hypothetical protein
MKDLVTSERAQFLDDVLITALEGGIGYWALALRYNPDSPATAIIRDVDEYDSGQWAITRVVIRNGLNALTHSQNVIKAGPRQDRIKLANLANDAGIIDAGDADVIVQAGLFGEIVYG